MTSPSGDRPIPAPIPGSDDPTAIPGSDDLALIPGSDDPAGPPATDGRSDDDPSEVVAAPATPPGPPGGRVFTLEGRPVPALYLLGWILPIAGIAAGNSSSPRSCGRSVTARTRISSNCSTRSKI